MSAQAPNQAPLLYERVAHLVEKQIATGALRANDRIPSVRSMSRAAKVSVSTVVQAYVHLENIGLIEARPQSGFYVRPPDPRVVPEPRRSIPRFRPWRFIQRLPAGALASSSLAT